MSDRGVENTAARGHSRSRCGRPISSHSCAARTRRRPWLAQFAETGRHRLFVADVDGEAVGFASSHGFRPKGAYATSVETSIYLAPGSTGRGIGARLYDALFDALAREDVHRAYAGITLPNAASTTLHERHGFARVAVFDEVGFKHGRYWSVAWYEKRLR